MEDPSKELSEAEVQLEDAEFELKFAVAQGKLKSGMTKFQKPSEVIIEWCSEKSIGFSDLREELAKIETEYAKLNEEHAAVIAMKPMADLSELAKEFESLVEDEYARCKKVGFTYLQADVPPVQASSPANESRNFSSYSNTKKETVKLPKFSGEESTAYKSYPIWRKQWDSHIMDYDEKSRSTMHYGPASDV